MELIRKVEDYWNEQPCNIKYSAAKIGSKKYFNEVEKRKYFVEPHILEFANFNKWKSKKVLEIGCGIGTDSINFVRAGADLTIIELSAKSLNLCRRRFDIFNLKAKFYLGNAEELSSIVPIEKYDLIYSFGVIHHSPNPHKIIEEIKKYCSNKTEIRIMLYSKWSWKMLWIFLKYKTLSFKKYTEAQTGSPISYCFSFKEIRKLLKNFEITKMWKEHIFPYRIKDYKNYKYNKIWYFKLMPKLIFKFLEKIFGWHILIMGVKK